MTLVDWCNFIILLDLRLSADLGGNDAVTSVTLMSVSALNMYMYINAAENMHSFVAAVMPRIILLSSIYLSRFDVSDIILLYVCIRELKVRWHVIWNWSSFVQLLLLCVHVWISTEGVGEGRYSRSTALLQEPAWDHRVTWQRQHLLSLPWPVLNLSTN